MTIEQIIFILVSAFTLIASVIVVTDRNLFRAAIALMASFLGVAGLYVLLEAGFLAVAQLLVYIGAISILMIFAIMMTRRLMQTVESPFNSQWRWGVIAAVVAFLLLAVIVVQTWPSDVISARPDVSDEIIEGTVARIGQLMVSPSGFALVFEVASVLLLAALVGSIVIAWPEKDS